MLAVLTSTGVRVGPVVCKPPGARGPRPGAPIRGEAGIHEPACGGEPMEQQEENAWTEGLGPVGARQTRGRSRSNG
ncbi:hypothetical protein GCM10022206_93230 [Streptomyces chiangmaiensis]